MALDEKGRPRAKDLRHPKARNRRVVVSTLTRAAKDALDPVKVPSKGRSLKDMTPAEQAEMRRLYEKK